MVNRRGKRQRRVHVLRIDRVLRLNLKLGKGGDEVGGRPGVAPVTVWRWYSGLGFPKWSPGAWEAILEKQVKPKQARGEYLERIQAKGASPAAARQRFLRARKRGVRASDSEARPPSHF